MRNFTWNRFPIKNLLIDSLLTPMVESAYLNRDMCKFESSQKDESRWQSTDSSKAYRNTSAFKCEITLVYLLSPAYAIRLHKKNSKLYTLFRLRNYTISLIGSSLLWCWVPRIVYGLIRTQYVKIIKALHRIKSCLRMAVTNHMKR